MYIDIKVKLRSKSRTNCMLIPSENNNETAFFDAGEGIMPVCCKAKSILNKR